MRCLNVLRKLIPAACFLVAATRTSAAPQQQNQPAKPNVFLITIDTVRADHVHCYGYDAIRTPALDSLANDGVRFSQAFTPSPITNSSHTTILTGLLPSSHGVTDFGIPLATTHSTWAEIVKGNGYQTAAFIGAVILDSKTLAPGLDRGFDFYDNFPQRQRTKSRWGRVERRGMTVVSRAEAWLTAHPTGSHFVWVHLYDPHDPYQPPLPYSSTYKDRLYDGEIAYADSAVAHFVAHLKKLRWYRNALIIVVGDHGEGLGEHHEATHGIFLYDSTTHVPLIAKLPGLDKAGAVIDAQVRTTDILPTVLDLLHISLPVLSQLDGASLQPYFEDANSAGRPAYGETDYPIRFGWAPLRSLRTEGFKFIEAPRPELYDLHSDPKESNNNYQPWDATVKHFRGLLADQRARTPVQNSDAAIAADTLNELRALGYLGPADAGSATNVPEPSLLPDPKDRIEEQNLLHAAMIATEADRPAEARDALEKLLHADPDSFAALRQLGEIELRAGQFRKAAEHLKHAGEIRPNDTSTAFGEAEALEKTGDLATAQGILEAALKVAPSQASGRLLLGNVYLGLKNASAAKDQFEAVLLLQPDDTDAALGLARAEIAQGDLNVAIERLSSVSKLHPNNPDVFTVLAEALLAANKPEAAQRADAKVKQLLHSQHTRN